MSAFDEDSFLLPGAIDALVARYLAIGNSITAGFQSTGTNDNTQLESYVVLMAQHLGLELGE